MLKRLDEDSDYLPIDRFRELKVASLSTHRVHRPSRKRIESNEYLAREKRILKDKPELRIQETHELQPNLETTSVSLSERPPNVTKHPELTAWGSALPPDVLNLEPSICIRELSLLEIYLSNRVENTNRDLHQQSCRSSCTLRPCLKI